MSAGGSRRESSPSLELLNNLRVVYARAWVRVRAASREPHWFAAEVVIPVLYISALALMYGFLEAPAYLVGFVVVGGAMIAFWSNILWGMATQFYWEKETGNLEMYMIAPISRMAVLLGMALGGVTNAALRAGTILLFGYYAFQARLNFGEPLALPLVFALTLASLYSLGMLFSSLFMLLGREARHAANLLEEPMYFLSGFFFPVLGSRHVPLALQMVASLIPMTIGLDAIRRVLILGDGLGGIMLHALALTAFVSVLLPLSRRALSYMEGRSKREGRLTLRWQ